MGVILLILVLALAACSLPAKIANADQQKQQAERLEGDVEFLSDDALEGQDPPAWTTDVAARTSAGF